MRLDEFESLESFFFEGTVDNLRALMKRLQVQHPQGWPASTGEQLYWREREPWDDVPLSFLMESLDRIIDKTLPTEKTWDVWRVGDVVGRRREHPRARIHAFEERANLTVIFFQDGVLVRDEPTEKIGLAFEEFAQAIIEAMGAEMKPEVATVERRVHPDIQRRRQEVKDLYQDGYTILQMALRIGCSESTIKRDLKALGLKIKQRK